MVAAMRDLLQESGQVQAQGVEIATLVVIPVLLADSQAIWRAETRKIFLLENDIRVVAEVESVPSLHSAVERFPNEIVLLENDLISASEHAIPQLFQRAPHVKIIVQTMAADESSTVELYRRGVRGVIPKSISPELLVKCVRDVAAGETWMDNQSVTWIVKACRRMCEA